MVTLFHTDSCIPERTIFLIRNHSINRLSANRVALEDKTKQINKWAIKKHKTTFMVIAQEFDCLFTLVLDSAETKEVVDCVNIK